MKSLFSTINKIDDTLMNLMFLTWLIVAPCYLFFSNQTDINQSILQLGFLIILYISFSSFKLFTSNPKIESVLKLIFVITYAFIFINNVNLFALTWSYCALLGLASLKALLEFTSSVIRLFLKFDSNLI